MNKHTGKAFLTQELIAQILGISERTVFAEIKELEGQRYVIVKRREFGTIVRRTPTGREIQVRVAGGKGVANTYIPTVDGSQVSATNRGLKLAERCDWNKGRKNPSQRSQPVASLPFLLPRRRTLRDSVCRIAPTHSAPSARSFAAVSRMPSIGPGL